jgi:hypothetical protein
MKKFLAFFSNANFLNLPNLFDHVNKLVYLAVCCLLDHFLLLKYFFMNIIQ